MLRKPRFVLALGFIPSAVLEHLHFWHKFATFLITKKFWLALGQPRNNTRVSSFPKIPWNSFGKIHLPFYVCLCCEYFARNQSDKSQ